jgi:hypothetical protein
MKNLSKQINSVAIGTLITSIAIAFSPFLNRANAAAIDLSTPYTQNFDTFGIGQPANTATPWNNDSTIPGWYSNQSQYRASIGDSDEGSLYSFGSAGASDRAFGSITSTNTGTIFFGARFVNNTANPITGLTISYTTEQWRNGGSGVPETFDFQYNIGANAIDNSSTGSWTSNNANGLILTSPVNTATAGALDGNAAANRVAITGTIDLSATPLAAGQEIWVRWQDQGTTQNQNGLAIDDFSATSSAVVPEPLTIIGSGTALAFGGVLKRKFGSKKKLSAKQS